MSQKISKPLLTGLVGGLIIGIMTLGDLRLSSFAAQAKQDQTPVKAQAEGENLKPDQKILALYKDRVAILKAMVEATKLAHQRGGVTADAVMRLEVRQLKAELELCQTDSERIAVHEKIIEVLKSIEETYVRSAKLTSVYFELQEARLDRMDAEIALNQVKARGLGAQNKESN